MIKNNYIIGCCALMLILQGLYLAADASLLSSRRTKKTVPLKPVETVSRPDTVFISDGSVAPDVPDSIQFCGKTIDLRRYDRRERYDREMLAMMYMHSSTLLMMKRANRYFPVIEPILKANGIPDDMKYLACIESDLNERAVSAAKAVGMWQFMPETGRQYGLEVNDEVDERYNVERSTEAACNYLKYAYSIFGDWATVAASYNSGYSRISRELLRQRAGNGIDLWLVDETMRYVFRIITCKEFLQDPKKYGFYVRKEQLYPPMEVKDTLISGKVSNWIDVADSLGISYYDLKSFNNWIRCDSMTNQAGKSYKVSYPVKSSKWYDPKKIPVHQKNWVTDAD